MATEMVAGGVVMASITLKNVPPELMERLRTAAKSERRSLTQQALHLIEGGLSAADMRPAAEVRAQLSRWRELAGRWVSSESFEEEIAGIQSARTAGRVVDL